MSKEIGEITISVRLDENIDKLHELCNEIRELSDLIPDWNRMEAEKHEQQIQDILFKLIKTNGTN